MSRRKSRQATLKLLYSWDLGVKNPKNSADKIIDLLQLSDEETLYMIELFDKIVLNKEVYDREIEKNLHDWKLDRLAIIERNILRLAVSELDSNGSVPKQVVINEAVELAKMYCDSNAYKFINGVLANIKLDE